MIKISASAEIQAFQTLRRQNSIRTFHGMTLLILITLDRSRSQHVISSKYFSIE